MKSALTILLALVVVVAIAAAWAPTPQSPAAASTSMGSQAHIEQHAAMTQQMTAGGPPQVMNTDPMWRMMRDPAHIRAEEQYQRDLDRMLGRGGR